jgi:threonine/homoserine/homoserine lactone efflux protein
MTDLELLGRGMLAGLAISAPVGPVNVLCISRTLSKGRAAGVISGLGAATADTVYGAIAGFSISFVIEFLLREEFWFRLGGGTLLIAIGILYYCKKPRPLAQEANDGAHPDFISAFLLTLTNPTVILSFLALLAALGMGHHRARYLTVLLIAGIFLGAMLWWIALAAATSHFRDRFDDRAMLWMNRIAGLAIGAFGIVTLALSRWRVD